MVNDTAGLTNLFYLCGFSSLAIESFKNDIVKTEKSFVMQMRTESFNQNVPVLVAVIKTGSRCWLDVYRVTDALGSFESTRKSRVALGYGHARPQSVHLSRH